MIQLDTHAVLWRELEPHKLSAPAHFAIESAARAGDAIAVSSMTLWEIALLASRIKIQLLVPAPVFLKQIEDNYQVLSVTGTIATAATAFPAPFPKDPMDRLIAATALTLDLTLITADRSIHASQACKLLW